MTSYFEKLTSINTSSLSLMSGKFQSNSDVQNIEELKKQIIKLELDLKCEHDEKNELVGLKVGLESEILELREIVERLEFQVEQLKDEKDKIHHVLAQMREREIEDGLFIASSGGGSGVVKKFPSLEDLTTIDQPTQTSTLERIEELDESALESIRPEPNQKQTLENLTKRIAFLESENQILRLNNCTKCTRPQAQALVFDHEDEGLVLSAVDEQTPEPFEFEHQDETQINAIVEMQRKIIEKLEREVWRMEGGVREEVTRMKVELEKRLDGIVRKVREGDGVKGVGGD